MQHDFKINHDLIRFKNESLLVKSRLSCDFTDKLSLCNRCGPGAEQARWETIRWRRPASVWGITLTSISFSTCGCIGNCCWQLCLLFVLFLGVCDLLWAGHQQHHHVRPGEEVLGQAVCGFRCKNMASHSISCSMPQFENKNMPFHPCFWKINNLS